MIRPLHILHLLVLLALSAGAASAQVTTGTPPFGSFGGGPDVINLANLNSHITVPVLHKPGRGSDFDFYLTYDSSIWGPVTSSGTTSWQPASNWGWAGSESAIGHINQTTTSATTVNICQQQIFNVTYSYSWAYVDGIGTVHPFPGTSLYSSPSSSPCGTYPNTGFTATATDGSGYTLTVFANSVTSLYGSDGRLITAPVSQAYGGMSGTTSSIQDRNGNIISADGNGNFYDTLSSTTPVLTLAGSGTSTSPRKFTYTTSSGLSAYYQVNYTNYTVATNFGISGISEYKSSAAVPLVSSIVLPDGSQYSFLYEATPTTPAAGACTPYAGTTCVTARVTSITFPTGGAISYAYTGGNNGIFSDGSTAGLKRYTPDTGTGSFWKYDRATGTGAASTTTVTDPLGNQTVLQFQGIYETQRMAYQGSTTGTLLHTVNTCYNGSTSPCTATAIVLPVTQRAVIAILPGSGNLQSKHVDFYNAYGLPTETDEYDFGSGAPPATPIRKTLATYATLGNGIVDRPASVTVQNGAGTTKAQTTFAYDETAATATSGTPQHVAISGSRGNATTINSLVRGTTFLTKTITYFDTGNAQTVTDVNGAQTTYTYASAAASCGNSFPTGVTLPLSLSKSTTWNCTGGVATQITDENGKNTTTAYTDASFWRPASVTDATSAVTNFYYPSSPSYNTTESSLSFNSGTSIVDVLTTLDGLGRNHVQQKRQSPGSSNFDSVETDYDSLGRPNRVTPPYSATSAGQTNPSPAPATTATYDALGRPLTVTDAGTGTASYTYTQNDVLVAVGPAPAGENPKQRQLEYDALGRLTSVCEITSATGSGTCGQTVSQTGFWTKYTYDVLGNLTGVTQNAQAAAGSQQTRSYTYDFLGRRTSETNPEPGLVTYTFDTDATCGTSNGDLVKRVDAVGNTTCYAHDLLHRVTSLTYSGPYAASTPNKYFVYDAATVNGVVMVNPKGRLAEAYTATSQAGTKITDLGLGYSARGEVTDVYQSTPHSGGYYHLTQSYWANGVPSQLSGLPGLPTTISYGVDGEGRPSTTSASSGQNPVTATSYNVFGRPTQVTFGSLDSDAFVYDANTGRMSQYQFSVNAQSVTGALTWNANGTLKQLAVTDPFNAADTQTCNYVHDDLTRLASANCGSAAAQTFTYDSFGNINKSGSPNSFLPTYSPSTNRMTSLPGYTPTYDANGNVTNDSLHAYGWDAAGRPVTIDAVGVTYDALGRMVEQNRSGAYTEIVYGPTGNKLALMSGQTLQKAFVPLPAGGTAVYTSSGLAYYRHSDWLGSSRFASTPTRTMYSDTAYAPFGEPYAQAGTTDLSFTGQNQDTVSNLYDFAAREYGIQGRWPSPDPMGGNIGNPQSLNRYAYVRNNPLALTDPRGLDPGERDHPHIDAVDARTFLICMALGGSCGGSTGCYVNGFASSCGIISRMDPFDLLTIPVVGPSQWVYLDASSTGVYNLQTGETLAQMGWETNLEGIFNVAPLIGYGMDFIDLLIPGAGGSTPPQTQTPAKPPKKPCTPLAHDPNAQGIDTLVDAFSRFTHPLDMLAVNAAMFVSAGGQIVGGGMAIAGGCLEPTPFEPLTCFAGATAGGAVAASGVATGAFGVYFFKNYTLPAFKDWGCHE